MACPAGEAETAGYRMSRSIFDGGAEELAAVFALI
jgi:hypothetical protein